MRLPTKANSSPLVSLTPLIDVVFILLIFFMLVSQFNQLQQLNLPLSQTSKTSAARQKPLKVIRLLQQKNSSYLSYIVNNQPMAWPQLTAYIQSNSSEEFVLAPAPDIRLQQFIQVSEDLSRLGIKNIDSEFIAYDVN